MKTALATNTNMTVTQEDGITTENWPIRSFFKTEHVDETLRDSTTARNCWIWVGGSQTGFDAVHIYGNNKIRFVQTTAGEKDAFNLYAVDSLPRRLKEESGFEHTHVDFVIVRPDDDDRAFELGTATGRIIGDVQDFRNNSWKDRSDPRDNVRYLRIAWD